MKRRKFVSCLLISALVLGMMGCTKAPEKSGEDGKSDLKVDTSQNTEGTKVNEDFSKNVNVNRASDYAKNEIKLPIEGIGRGVSTSVKGKENYKVVVMTRNSTKMCIRDRDYAIVLKKGNDDLTKKINDAIASLKEDGTFDKIVDKYIK